MWKHNGKSLYSAEAHGSLGWSKLFDYKIVTEHETSRLSHAKKDPFSHLDKSLGCVQHFALIWIFRQDCVVPPSISNGLWDWLCSLHKPPYVDYSLYGACNEIFDGGSFQYNIFCIFWICKNSFCLLSAGGFVLSSLKKIPDLMLNESGKCINVAIWFPITKIKDHSHLPLLNSKSSHFSRNPHDQEFHSNAKKFTTQVSLIFKLVMWIHRTDQ